jgi:phospholipase/carboxylesterase
MPCRIRIETMFFDLASAVRMRIYKVEWHDYPMPHSVCPEEIRDMAGFLLRIL